MVRSFCMVMLLSVVFAGTCLAVPNVVIEPYPARKDLMTGEVQVWGHKIVHHDYDVQLQDVIMKVPILSIQYEGLHHVRGQEKKLVEARAKCIAERLAIAWQLLDAGATLQVRDDDWNTWRIHHGSQPPGYPAIYVVSSALGPNRLRIMTVYPQDAVAFPGANNDTGELANYIVALIEAHYMLFARKSARLADYENLKLDQTREGKIFKEIFIRAQEVLALREQQEQENLNEDVLKDALARVAMPQRERLVRLAFKAPPDWLDVQK